MAMATEETSDDLVGSSSASASTQRQRFYIELKPGETTIVSWKKLLRQGKTTTVSVMESSQKTGTRRSSAYGSTKRPLDDNSEVCQCSGHLIRSEKLENQNISSGCQQMSVKRTELEGKKNDDWPQSSEVDATLLIYRKKSATFSKSNCPLPVNARNASKFPLKTKQSAFRKTDKFSFGMSRIKEGNSDDTSDVMHQNSARKCVLLQTNPRCSTLIDDKKMNTSYKNQRSDKSGGCRELLDAVSPGYSSLHSKSASFAVNDLRQGIKETEEEETVAGSKSFKVSSMMKEHIRSSEPKRKVTYLMSSLPDKEPARKRKQQQQRFQEKQHVKIRFPMKPQHEIHMYEKRASIDKMN